MIETLRLRLIPASPEVLRAELAGPATLAAALGVEIPPGWPPELYDRPAVEYCLGKLEAHPEEAGWWFHYFVRRPVAGQPATAVGAGGYKGPPQDGTVEIGYSILPEHRRRGYACEATQGLAAHALERPGIGRVIAQTLPHLEASIGVLQKCGFRFAGEGSEEGAVCYELVERRGARA
jgi:ribosomal-protein-alanine N-acetyltransferase